MLDICAAFHPCESSHGSKMIKIIQRYHKVKLNIHTFQFCKLVKLFWQNRQKCKPMPVWIFWWSLIILIDEKCFPQIVQMYLFCPVWQNGLWQCPCCLSRSVRGGWMSWMGIMLLVLVNANSWLLLWLVKMHMLVNAFWHISHTNSSFIVWLESLKLDCSTWPLAKPGIHDRWRADGTRFNQGINLSYESKSTSKFVWLSSILKHFWVKIANVQLVDFVLF